MKRTVILSLTAALLVFAAAPAAHALAEGGSVAQASKKSKKKKKKKKKKRPRPAATAPAAPGSPAPDGPPGCVNDASEPDHSGSASPLDAISEAHLERIICPGDSDWFSVTLPPGAGYTLHLLPAPGFDGSLGIQDGSGGVLGQVDQYGIGGSEETTISNAGDQPVVRVIEVAAGQLAGTGGYQLQGTPVEPDPGPPCDGDDSAEPDDDVYSATVIEWPGTSTALQRFLCPGDRDFFEITVPADSYFQFEAGGELDVVLELYDGDGDPILVEDNRGPSQTEYLQIGNPYGTPLTRWVAVAGATPTETGHYAAEGNDT